MHGQLVASAYIAALDLAPEEEAILGAALQKLSKQNDMATPSSLFDVLGSVEGFRGFYVDKLKGRVGSLKLLETTIVENFGPIMGGGALVSFASPPYPQAAALAFSCSVYDDRSGAIAGFVQDSSGLPAPHLPEFVPSPKRWRTPGSQRSSRRSGRSMGGLHPMSSRHSWPRRTPRGPSPSLTRSG